MDQRLFVFAIGTLPPLAIFLWLLSRKRRWIDANPHLRTLPFSRLKYLVAGRFFLGGSMGFIADLLHGGAFTRTVTIVLASLFGAVFGLTQLVRKRTLGVRLVVIGIIAVSLSYLALGNLHAPVTPSAAAYRFDAFGIFVTAMIGQRLYLQHISTEGARQIRAETELELAHRLQQVLVPGINFQNTRLEVYGRSIPSDKVGGDLVDLVATESGLLAYLLDVSGHGIPAGALMGSLKMAIHMAFQRPMPEMLDRINRELPSIKEPNMYATLSALEFDMSGESIEYTLAGHMPILLFRANEVESLTCEQLPLGLFPVARYESRSRSCGPGDLFVMYSDGIVEVANAEDEQFGLDRLESQIRSRSSESLQSICDAVMDSSAQFGLVDDDRSLLLIRVIA